MLRTPRDAGEYIQELPRAKHQRPEWQIAAEMLLAAVEGSGPLMFAETAKRKAVNAESRSHVTGGGSSPAARAVQTGGGGGYDGHFGAAQGFRYFGQRGVEG